MVEYQKKEKILHIIYKKVEDIPKYIISLADEYEGKINNRIGFNFPISKNSNKLIEKYPDILYVIVYKKGDILTKIHEELHAKYYIDDEYKNKVKNIWDSLTKESKKKVFDMLEKMKYPKDEKILIDEFQAYFFSEKKNFFGKLTYN